MDDNLGWGGTTRCEVSHNISQQQAPHRLCPPVSYAKFTQNSVAAQLLVLRLGSHLCWVVVDCGLGWVVHHCENLFPKEFAAMRCDGCFVTWLSRYQPYPEAGCSAIGFKTKGWRLSFPTDQVFADA